MSLPSGFYGGWSLIADTCPTDTDACGSRSCCPTGSFCDTSGSSYSNLCCPGTNDCSNAVKSLPQCADSTWILFNTIKDPICCQPGEIALQPQGSSLQGSCVDAAGTYPASLLAPSATRGSSGASSASASTAASSKHTTSIYSTTAAAAVSSSSSHASSASPTASSHSATTLPIKTIAGAAVGAAVLLLIAFFLCCFCICRRKKKSRQAPAAGVGYVPYEPVDGRAGGVPYNPYDHSGGANGQSYAMMSNLRTAENIVTGYKDNISAAARELHE